MEVMKRPRRKASPIALRQLSRVLSIELDWTFSRTKPEHEWDKQKKQKRKKEKERVWHLNWHNVLDDCGRRNNGRRQDDRRAVRFRVAEAAKAQTKKKKDGWQGMTNDSSAKCDIRKSVKEACDRSECQECVCTLCRYNRKQALVYFEKRGEEKGYERAIPIPIPIPMMMMCSVDWLQNTHQLKMRSDDYHESKTTNQVEAKQK